MAVPARILQLLQLLQDSPGLVSGVDQHAQQLEGGERRKSSAQIGSKDRNMEERERGECD